MGEQAKRNENEIIIQIVRMSSTLNIGIIEIMQEKKKKPIIELINGGTAIIEILGLLVDLVIFHHFPPVNWKLF